jgi:hypothetical protein
MVYKSRSNLQVILSYSRRAVASPQIFYPNCDYAFQKEKYNPKNKEVSQITSIFGGKMYYRMT